MNILTLVILTFRDGESCLETIKSGLKITEAKFVVIDCNIEPDWRLREQLFNTVPESRFEYFMFGESSIPQAMNFGLTKSKGHWVWFLNSGDVINDVDIHMLKRDLNSKVDLLIGDSKISNELGLINDWKYPAMNSAKFSFGMNTYCHQACIFNRNSLDLWNGFPLVDHFDWLTTFYFTTKLETKLISSFTIHYKSGGKSSNENLLSWALTNYKIRRKFRWLFHGNIYSDGVVYIFYIPLRMFLNMLDSRRQKNWWKVGN